MCGASVHEHFHPQEEVYEVIEATTRYGDVRDLLRNVDDRFVVFGSGEGVKLEFDLSLPCPRAGCSSVEPPPHHTLLPYRCPPESEYPSDAEHLYYQLDYNTRQHSGRLPPSLRHHFH